MSFKRASQLSLHLFAVWTRLELATPCVTGMYSNQLNYQTVLCVAKSVFCFCDAKVRQFGELCKFLANFFLFFLQFFSANCLTCVVFSVL